MKKLILLASLTHLQLKGELLSPEDGSVINHIHVFFEWTQIPEATAYDFQLSSDPSYNIVNVEVTDNSLGFVEEELIEWGTTYFWRVRPIFALGTGTWSESYSFTTTESMSSSSVNLIQDCCYGNGITVFGAFFNYFSAAIDKTGREIWNSGNTDFVYYGTSQNGNVFGANLILGSDNNLPGSEIDFEGNVIWQEPNDEFLHHDLILLPNGNYLGIVETTSLGPIPIGSWTSSFQTFGFQANGITDEFPWVGDKIVEWDRDTKEVVWSWNVFDYFSMEDYDRIGGTWNEALQSLRYDWTHINAVIFDNEESSIYMSVRHLSRITKIAYPSGDVIWNLGHDMPSGDVHLGTDIGFSFQHGLQKLENGNILTLDNGNLSPEFRGTSQPITRAIEIQIDGLEASTIWSHELEPDLFGFASGNAQKLPNGNVLITTVGGGGRSVEVNTSGDIVWEGLYNLSIPDGAVYRAHRIPGLFPAAFTFIVNELVGNNGQPEVRLPVGDSEISFKVVNEGKYDLELVCTINDEAGWFGNQEIEIQISPFAENVITFYGSTFDSPSINNISLTATPSHHNDAAKTVSFYGVLESLNSASETPPSSFELNQVYPNPFNSQVKIDFSLHHSRNMRIEILNLTGQLQDTILNDRLGTGEHSIIWTAADIAAGVYFIRLSSKGISEIKKVVLLK